MAQENVYRDDWAYLDDDEYAPAQVYPDVFVPEGASRPIGAHCEGCWHGLGSPPAAVCGTCGRTQGVSELEWLKLKYSLSCARCGHEIREEDEGSCPECSGTKVVAA